MTMIPYASGTIPGMNEAPGLLLGNNRIKCRWGWAFCFQGVWSCENTKIAPSRMCTRAALAYAEVNKLFAMWLVPCLSLSLSLFMCVLVYVCVCVCVCARVCVCVCVCVCSCVCVCACVCTCMHTSWELSCCLIFAARAWLQVNLILRARYLSDREANRLPGVVRATSLEHQATLLVCNTALEVRQTFTARFM